MGVLRGHVELSAEEFVCRLCSNADASEYLIGCPDYFLNNRLVVDYLRCNKCKMVQQHPIPKDIQSLYSNYPIHRPRNFFQRLARRLFHKIYFQPQENSKNKVLLDYGCGDGSFLQEVKENFKQAFGYEPGKDYAVNLSKRLEEIEVFGNKEKLLSEKTNTFDIVTAHFVVEHLDDLHGTFMIFNKLLKRNGFLYIAVPNIGSWESLLFKRKWHGLDAPRHLLFPELVHFKFLAEKYKFSDLKTRYAPFSNTLAASMSTTLFGRYSGFIMALLTLPSWVVSLFAPQGSLVVEMRKSGELMEDAD